MVGVDAWACMDADNRKLRLSPLESTLLRVTVVFYLRGVMIDRGIYACCLALVSEARSTGQTCEEAINQLLIAGLIEERITGNFQPTPLAIDQRRTARLNN
jgi:hypothetical protein